MVSAPKMLVAINSGFIQKCFQPKSQIWGWGDGYTAAEFNWRNEWMQLRLKLHPYWVTFPHHLSVVSTALEVSQSSHITWTSCSTVFPKNPRGHRQGYRAGNKATEAPGTRSTASLCGNPVKHQSRKRWPLTANPVNSIQQAFMGPGDVSGTPLDAEDDRERKKNMTVSSKRS